MRLLLFLFIFGYSQINAQWANFCTGNTDGFVVDFARYNNSIYCTGFFQNVCDADAEFVASWDGSNWNSTDNTFNQEGHAIDSINGLLYASLYQFTTDSNYVYTYNGMSKASVIWLVMGYGVITIGELFLSPMGLSLVSKLSPTRITSLMMGGWFVSTSIGNKLSGVLATLWDTYENKANYFWLNFALLLFASALMLLLLRWLNKVMKEKGIN